MNVMPLLATNLVILNFLQKNNNMTDMWTWEVWH
jgi:hypothetical protein